MVKLWTPVLSLAALVALTATTTTTNAQQPLSVSFGVAQPAAATVAPAAPVTTTKAPATTRPTVAKSSAATPAPTTTARVGKGTNPLVIKGYRFFDSVTGEYFGMRGVNYYPRPNTGPLDANNLDLFTMKNAQIWQRDIPQFVALSANAIRLYAVDPLADHTEFMCQLQAAGIYVMVDLGANCQGCEITADQAPACYPASYKKRGEQIIRNFAKYDNVIAFSGGNEINHRTGGNPPEWNAPCQKKFVRDMRKYIDSCPTMRKIPMGLVVADTHREENAKYYNCRTDPSDKFENAEWYGINVYVHCNDEADSTKAGGFNNLRQSFLDYKYSIPTVLTEFGCTSPAFPTKDGFKGQRTFHDAKWMNQAEYSDVFNGGFVFEYTTENANSKSTVKYPFRESGPQNYGLGYLSPEDCTDADDKGKCAFVRFPNFHSLAQAYNTTDTSKEPTLTSFQVDPTRTQRSQCPAGFPKLKDLKWAGDATASESCPQIKRYQCPNVAVAAQTDFSKALEAKDMVEESTTASSAGLAATDSIKEEDDEEEETKEEGEEEEEEEGDDGSMARNGTTSERESQNAGANASGAAAIGGGATVTAVLAAAASSALLLLL